MLTLIDTCGCAPFREQTAVEWGMLLVLMFLRSTRSILARVDGIIVASVVPPIVPRLAEMASRYFHMEPMFVNSSTDTGLAVLYDNPREVGADRIVNSVAAFYKYGGPCVHLGAWARRSRSTRCPRNRNTWEA